MSKSNQRGFTMIELVVVIVILGILAAFALPRYMGLENQARVAALNGMEGSIRSAANMAHGVWLANGNVSPITVDGKTVTIVSGYPDVASIQNLIQDTAGFTVTPNGTTNVAFYPTGARTNANCRVTYTPASAGTPYFQLVIPVSQAALQTNC